MRDDARARLELFDRDQRITARFFGFSRQQTGLVVRHVPTDGSHGYVVHSRLTEETADDAIRGEIAYFASLGTPFEWKLYGHDLPADLEDRLAAAGFVLGELETVMVLDLVSAPVALLAPRDVYVDRVRDRAGLEAVAEIKRRVWGLDARRLADGLWAELSSAPEGLSVYVAFADGRPACSAWVRFTPGSQFASFWGGSTLPEYRGRGLYSATLAARAREAIERGVRYLTVDASPESRPILERHGFEALVTTRPCMWTPPH